MMRRLVNAVALPLVATLVLTLFVSITMSSSLPKDMSSSAEWSDFANHVSIRMQATTTPTRVLLLLGMHSLHVYMCLPMLHITKVLYGFWLGVWVGWSLCCAWELLLFYIYLRLIHREPQQAVCAYTADARSDGILFRENVAFGMSSLPLQASASLVQFGDVTTAEFMRANALVTVIMSMKNVVCGAVLASAPSRHVLLILAAVLAFSTVLPTVSTFYVSSKTLLAALHANDHESLLADEIVLDLPSDCEDAVEYTHDNTVACTHDNTVACTHDNTVACTHDNTVECTKDNADA